MNVGELSPAVLKCDLSIPTETASAALPGSDPAKQTSQLPQSKWEEIRMANNSAPASSAWDKLRQKHERDGVDSKERPNSEFA